MKFNISKVYNIDNLILSFPCGSQIYKNKIDKSDIDFIAIFSGKYLKTKNNDELINQVNLVKKKYASNQQIITYMYGKILPDNLRLMVEFISKDDLELLSNVDFIKPNKIKILKVFMGDAVIYVKTSTRNIYGRKLKFMRERLTFHNNIIGLNSEFYITNNMQLGMFLDKLLIGLVPLYIDKIKPKDINIIVNKLINNFVTSINYSLMTIYTTSTIKNNPYKIFYSSNKFNKNFINKINSIFNV